MFTAPLFTIARTGKELRCPSADEWIRKLWCIYTMEYYSAIKRNAFESVLMRWMKMEPIIQSEVSQKENYQCSQIKSDQSLSRVRLFVTPWIAARQAYLSIINSQSSLRLTSIETVMPSSYLILCRSLLLLLPIPPSIRVFSNESTLRLRWPNY